MDGWGNICWFGVFIFPSFKRVLEYTIKTFPKIYNNHNIKIQVNRLQAKEICSLNWISNNRSDDKQWMWFGVGGWKWEVIMAAKSGERAFSLLSPLLLLFNRAIFCEFCINWSNFHRNKKILEWIQALLEPPKPYQSLKKWNTCWPLSIVFVEIQFKARAWISMIKLWWWWPQWWWWWWQWWWWWWLLFWCL